MPVPGTKPSDRPKRFTGAPTHEWIDVPDVPYTGPHPRLSDRDWHPLTRSWWRVISRMPHCVLWTESDWSFALTTALVADVFYATVSPGAAVELRQREKLLGTTLDARRDLRIRYVEPAEAPGVSMSTPAASDPRARLRVVGGGDDDAA
jgi:hypothetical protein